MSNHYRIASLVLAPLIALLIGWQWGASAQQQEVHNLQQRLAQAYGGSTQSGALMGDPEEEVDISLLWNVWRTLQSHYIEPGSMDAREMVFGAVGGMVRAVGDPYTVFMTPVENTDFHDALSGHLQGIGAELMQRENRIVVVTPLKGSPAEKAGLLPEDMIVQVDDTEILDMDLNEVVSLIRGPAGTRVSLKILREDVEDLLTFTITRDDITVPSTEYTVMESGSGSVGVLGVNQFGTETISEIRNILRDVDPAELDGFIIDLRYNGGGYLDGAVDLTSMFLESGTVVTVAGRDDERVKVHSVSGNPVLPDIPLVVLQNQASASASEIVAGALQDHDRATVIGAQSFGKGTVQEVLELPGGSSLRVTIAKWLTPDGKDLSKEGVVPNIEVERMLADAEAGIDPQMLTAVEWLLDGEDISGQFKDGSEIEN